MPQPRKYATRAAQQTAYRQRQAQAQQDLLARKGLPPLPPISTLPGRARWSAMLAQAQGLLRLAAEEMQVYHDERSEAWQESERAEEMLSRIDQLQEVVGQLQDLE